MIETVRDLVRVLAVFNAGGVGLGLLLDNFSAAVLFLCGFLFACAVLAVMHRLDGVL